MERGTLSYCPHCGAVASFRFSDIRSGFIYGEFQCDRCYHSFGEDKLEIEEIQLPPINEDDYDY